VKNSPLDLSGDVSVAIVHYRTPQVLTECLASFEEQGPARVAQVIVVDNSADGSISAVSQRFPWAEYLVNDANLYFRRANNQAAERARHRYLLFLNPDTRVVDSTSISLLADVLDREPTAGMVGPMMRGDDGLLAPQGKRVAGLIDLVLQRSGAEADQHDPSRHRAGFVDTVSAAAVILRRDDFENAGGFDERALMYWEEHELTRKLRKRGMRAYYQPASFIVHHWRKGGTETLAEAPKLFQQAEAQYYRQFFGLHGRAFYLAVRLLRAAARLLKAPRSKFRDSHRNPDAVRGPSE
jgi:GT2 family glycosyltransferase